MMVGVPALLLAGLLTVLEVTAWNYIPYVPLRVVVQEARRGNGAERDQAFVELNRRMGSLPDGDLQWLVDRALEEQGDMKRTWDERWGEIVVAAYASGHTRGGQWEQYLMRSMDVQLKVRPQVRQGDALPYEATFRPARGSRTEIWAGADLTLRVNGKSFTGTVEPPLGVSSGDWGNGAFPELLSAGLDPGSYDMTLELHVTTACFGAMPIKHGAFVSVHQQVLLVLPRSQLPVKLTPRPELQAQMEKAISIDSASWNTRNGLSFVVKIEHPPMDVAWDVMLVAEKGEVKLGSVLCIAGEFVWMRVRSFDAGQPDGRDSIAVVFRPSAETTTGTVDMAEIWDGVVRIERVKVAE